MKPKTVILKSNNKPNCPCNFIWTLGMKIQLYMCRLQVTNTWPETHSIDLLFSMFSLMHYG